MMFPASFKADEVSDKRFHCINQLLYFCSGILNKFGASFNGLYGIIDIVKAYIILFLKYFVKNFRYSWVLVQAILPALLSMD